MNIFAPKPYPEEVNKFFEEKVIWLLHKEMHGFVEPVQTEVQEICGSAVFIFTLLSFGLVCELLFNYLPSLLHLVLQAPGLSWS